MRVCQQPTLVFATIGSSRGGPGDRIYGLRGDPVLGRLSPAQLIENMLDAAAGREIVVRLNMSYRDEERERAYLATVERLRGAGRDIAAMIDLCGPKVRLSNVQLPNGGQLQWGDEFDLHFRESRPNTDRPGAEVRVNGQFFCSQVRRIDCHTAIEQFFNHTPGVDLRVGDGELRFELIEIAAGVARCRVVQPGTVKNGKGLTIVGADLAVPAFQEHDRRSLEFALRHGGSSLRYVAVSFVRNAGDIHAVRRFIDEWRRRNPDLARFPPPMIVAKLETPTAVGEHLEAIIAAADLVMVARGDLGEQLPAERIPAITMEVVAACNLAGKPVITATQMLASMEHSPFPTRAEASDVFHAVLDGTDGVMLSGESASGAYPFHAIDMMVRLVTEAEHFCTQRAREQRKTVCRSSRHSSGSALFQRDHVEAGAVRAGPDSATGMGH